MKESFPQKIINREPELSKEKVEENLQRAKDTGRLLEQAYWEAVKEGSVQHHIEPKEERATTLNPGEVFNPEKELAEIKALPKKERKEKLQEYKEELAYQKEGLARTQEELINIIRENPDISWADLYSKVIEMMDKYGVTWKQEETIHEILSKYYWRHLAIKKARGQFPDENKLFEAVFGRPSNGKIEVIEGPVTLYFRCYNIKDYALISQQTFLEDRDPTWKEKRVAKTQGGVSINTSLVRDLRGTIIAERAQGEFDDNQQRIYVHEEQHAIKRLFNERPIKKPKSYETEDLLVNLDDLCRREREQKAELKAKDEILAMMKEGRWSMEEVFYLLKKPGKKGGLYDYLAKDKEEIIKFYSNNKSPDEKKKVIETVKQVFETEYHKLIKNGIRSFQDLIDNGYTMEQTIALLNAEPLVKWPKIVRRLIKKQTK